MKYLIKKAKVSIRLDPEQRLCAKFDTTSISKFEDASQDMGVRVVDNCAEEDIM